MDGGPQLRTTGRIKKPKAVFDPSDNYLPRAQRSGNAVGTANSNSDGSSSLRRRKSFDAADGGDGGKLEDIKVNSKKSHLTSANMLVSGGTTDGANAPTGSSNSSNNNDLVDVCSVCQKKEAKRGSYAKNKLIACLVCDKRVHKLCMSMDFEDLNMLRQHYKCNDCRACQICGAVESNSNMRMSDFITCCKCVKSYHFNCHNPKVPAYQQTQRDWKCNKCKTPPAVRTALANDQNLPVETIREIIGDESIGRSTLQQQQQQHQQQQQQQRSNKNSAGSEAAKSNSGTKLKRSYRENETKALTSSSTAAINGKNGADGKALSNKEPVTSGASELDSNELNESLDLVNVKYWSVDQVTAFFAQYFPNEAYVFKEQEIDGMSLLLLKRSDVIKKLPIKLGPSLRIYSLILNIQTQRNDPTLGWDCSSI